MVIWLRSAQEISESIHGVGIEGGVIEREVFSKVLELDEGFKALETARKALNNEFKALREQAKKEVDQAFEEAKKQGYATGRQAAVEEWQSRTIEMLSNARHIQSRMRWRLSELVARAVEHIVHTTDRRALFERAMTTLEHISDGASLLHVSVHPDEVDAAQKAFDGFSKEWSARGQLIKVMVRAEAGLAPGSCVCESEFGMIDASLDVQLKAMRSALARALDRDEDELVEGLLAQVQVNANLSAAQDGDPLPVYSAPARRQSRERRHTAIQENAVEPLSKDSIALPAGEQKLLSAPPKKKKPAQADLTADDAANFIEGPSKKTRSKQDKKELLCAKETDEAVKDSTNPLAQIKSDMPQEKSDAPPKPPADEKIHATSRAAIARAKEKDTASVKGMKAKAEVAIEENVPEEVETKKVQSKKEGDKQTGVKRSTSAKKNAAHMVSEDAQLTEGRPSP